MKNVRDNQDLVYPRLPTFARGRRSNIGWSVFGASTSSWKKSKQPL